MEGKNISDIYKRIYIGNAVVGEDCYIETSNVDFHKYFGERIYFPIMEIFAEKDAEEIKSAIEGLSECGHREIAFPLVRKQDDIYTPAFVTVDRFLDGDTPKYEVEIWDALETFRSIKKYELLEKKYSKLVALSDGVFFEYRPATENFLMYYIEAEKYLEVFNGKFEEFKDYVSKNKFVDSENIIEYNDFCKNIESSRQYFLNRFACKFMPNDPDGVDVAAYGGVIMDTLGKSTIIGMIRRTEKDIKKNNFFSDKANMDPLTGLLNKRAITEYAVSKIQSSEQKLIIAIMDIDYFKNINDTYGHLVGDEVLCTIAATLQNAVAGKGIVGRIGGDEFFIVFDSVNDENELRIIIREIRFQINNVCKRKIYGINVTSTLGISEYPKDAKDYDTLFRIADKALYIGKLKGRNRFIIYKKELHGTLDDAYEKINSEITFDKPPRVKRLAAFKAIDIVLDAGGSMEEVMAAIKENYILDSMNIYLGDEFRLAYSTDTRKVYDSGIKHIVKLEKSGYFNDENMLAMDNYVIFEYRDKDAFEYLRRNGILSSIYCIIRKDGAPVGIISYESTANLRKWSDWDINMLTLISRMLSHKLAESL